MKPTANTYKLNVRLVRRCALCMLALLLTSLNAWALIIEGDVYGGGKDGNVGDSVNTANPTVNVLSDTVRTVFGGGLNGKVTGSTTVNVSGGKIGDGKYAGTANGGVYGAGEGVTATVSGSSQVNISGGTIINNVYGGGKMATLNGNSNVAVSGGTMQAQVYAGARAADIQGYSNILVSGSPIINSLFGGNDIGGSILNNDNNAPTFYTNLSNAVKSATVPNAFVHVTGSPFIANAFAGGNGDYTYTTNAGNYEVTLDSVRGGATGSVTFSVAAKPEVAGAFTDIEGGTFYNLFGGGNMATVTGSTNIYLNEAKTVTPAKLTDVASMTFLPTFDTESYTGTSDITFKKQIYHLFGGNNLADMAIRPQWNLSSGLVGSLYSGGNKGDMTHPNGIVMAVTGANMDVENVYGGCRMSDVKPQTAGVVSSSILEETIDGYTYPAGYSARVRIAAGTIGTVYGGNDISGDVYFGTNVVVQSNIVNDVYGAGNGSYPYTDTDPSSEYYFNAESTVGTAAIAKLNRHRPNSEKALITLLGAAGKTTYIGGSVYCGGNSATLRSKNSTSDANVGASIKIGSYVIANRVFMGSNGANMIDLGVLEGINNRNTDVALTDSAQFAEYMKGVEVGVSPEVTFTSDYQFGTTKIGSFYCGGNVGSMTSAGTFNIDFLNNLVIFEKLVAGCNNANVAKTAQNAYHMGGLTTHNDLKVKLDIDGLMFEPRKLTYNSGTHTFTFDWSKYPKDNKASDGFLKGGNIYGGCYESGYIDGGVEINILSDLITAETYNYMNTAGTDGNGKPVYGFHSRDWDHHSSEQSISTLSVYGGGYGEQTEIWGDVNINLLDNGRFLKIRGGSEKGWIGRMKRDANGNLVAGNDYVTSLPEGGTISVPTKQYRSAYNTTVTMNANVLTNSSDQIVPNIGDICGGGYEGVVTGNTSVYLNSGCAYKVFGGASNADIYGGSQVFVGPATAPYVTRTIYGGNDFGGQIMGTVTHTVNVSSTVTKKVRSNTYVDYVSGEIGYGTGELNSALVPDANYGIFGAAYGDYDYANSKYTGFSGTKPNMLARLKGNADTLAFNSFVNISSESTSKTDKVYNIYGGGEGYAGKMGVADTYNTYVLFNAQNAGDRGENENYIAQYVYAGGNCSKTNNSLLDAYKGYAKFIFGGCHGSNDKSQTLTYMGDTATVNLYPSLKSGAMDVFGSGALSGTKETFVNVLGGTVHDVYGSTYEEGITYQSTVNVPPLSKASVNSIFGGGMGLSEQNACDTYIAVINYSSDSARVAAPIYGGNNKFRMTRNSYVNISVPVMNSKGDLVDVYGAGYGAGTFASQTYVNLIGSTASGDAQVKNVYGGGQDGMVFNAPTLAKFLTTKDYYAIDAESATTYLTDDEIKGFETWRIAKGDAVITDGKKYSDLRQISLDTVTTDASMNTMVLIPEGTLVQENAYGAGYGADATVAGQTSINLLGGQVGGDVYGGGNAGDVKLVPTLALAATPAQNITTNVTLAGGIATNSYGGGYEGKVEGNANTIVGRNDCNSSTLTFLDGDPAIRRSLYGGGQKGAVTGTATLNMYNGHVGYNYESGSYVPNVNLREVVSGYKPDSLLSENGNVFGGGYGEGAYTTQTIVTMWNGTIRNSLYGGGEIASIGQGTTKSANDGSLNRILDTLIATGNAHLTIYNGHILRDVFGGGRGYSYDLGGNELTGSKYYTDGYVFGTTEVLIHGGEIGTKEGVDDGYGNVFGGGNVGFVYSTTGTKATDNSNGKTVGYYYDNSNNLTEDCRVVISPYCRVKDSQVTIGENTYYQCDYVPTEAMNYLKKGDEKWNSIDWQTGVTVHNAVFAGGNVTRGSDKLYANTTTVFGNVTATLNDIYHRDLITVGSDFVGGLYGDGNLTLVDGYREIAITNYGTDYYTLQSQISLDEYNALSDRERAYFTLQYVCKQANGNYSVDAKIEEEEYKKLSTEYKNTDYWVPTGFCSIYSGRILNTIQRADFCGVHGSRIVLQGAQDRVIDVMDYTKYAINRIGEVSLNRRNTVISDESEGHEYHGSYFGMYNIVNYLQALTSDVKFTDTRYARNSTYEADKNNNYIDNDSVNGNAHRSYFDFKKQKRKTQYRNNATSDNQISMSQGVYLELLDHIADSTETIDGFTYQAGDKVYGPITGIVELDLINASPDMGGGYVYARNIHGTPTFDASKQAKATLSTYNSGASTKAAYSYTITESADSMQTSGNFVHYLKQIVDDCYPNNGVYAMSPAHFWYMRGQVFVYEQNVSAYTGAATAYKANVQIPLTITSGSHGRLRVLEIKPNLYAYYKSGKTALKSGESFQAGGKTYGLNDVISYWDYSKLTPAEQMLFVDTTYVCKENLYSDSAHTTLVIAKDSVMLPATYRAQSGIKFYDRNGNDTDSEEWIRLSNATNHDNGFILTADLTNPLEWDDRYIRKIDQSGNKSVISKIAYDNLSSDEKSAYAQGPSFSISTDGIYGQRKYVTGEILSSDIYNSYQALGATAISSLTDQAVVEPAYISINTVNYRSSTGAERSIQSGVSISKTEYDNLTATNQLEARSQFEPAWVCNQTFMKGDVYVLNSELYSQSQYDSLSTADKKYFSEAYYCSKAGKYGGTQYSSGQNFEALGSFCAMSDEDRDKFVYNFDAFDILNDNLSGKWFSNYNNSEIGRTYIQQIPIQYAATCHTAFTYNNKDSQPVTVYSGQKFSNTDFESIPNERIHYSKITVKNAGDTVYVANQSFSVGSNFYPLGMRVSKSVYDEHTSMVSCQIFETPGDYYFCKENYVVGAQGEGVKVKNVIDNSEYDNGYTVPQGVFISSTDYLNLKNFQNYFSISGESPIETSTLYVPRLADINDQTTERIVTLVYQYQYEEMTADGTESEEVTERHILNIHIQFKTGVPTISELRAPSIVLPGSTIGLKQPIVAKGAYEIIGGGWEIYETKEDAENHENGIAYSNNSTPMYFYQDGYYAAYYTKTFLGKTYSNAVPFSVANYHSIDDVMADKQNHLHIDHPNVKRDCKIYITDQVSSTDTAKNEIDLLADLYKLTSTGLAGHSSVSSYIEDCANLDIILSENVSPKGKWQTIGTEEHCFDGNLHGDGNYISGLDKSLFNYFCGNVYNLGIEGSFSEAGLADHGSGLAINCWLLTTGTPNSSRTYPFFGTGAGILKNCYYTNDYKDISGVIGWDVYKKPLASFNNGEVAYDLNSYYLNKRYTDKQSDIKSNMYQYWEADPSDGHLVQYDNYALDEDATFRFTDSNDSIHKIGYVESRFIDGDFVYADGTIHNEVNERLFSDNKYFPIYPDDYLYFGQMLSYNMVAGNPHQEYPSAIVRTTEGRVLTSDNSSSRVYRAPAYYGNKNMQTVYFNVNALLPSVYTKSNTTSSIVETQEDSISVSSTATSTDVVTDGRTTTTKTVVTSLNADFKTRTVETTVTVATEKDAYLGLTAVDFTGSGDNFGYQKIAGGHFYTPVTDYEGLIGFNNIGQTQNMLVYADKTEDSQSYNVLSNYLTEPSMTEGTYNTVATVNNAAVSAVHGHLVKKLSDGKYEAESSHFLVDLQEFNAPIEYAFNANDVMWYQRKPDNFASLTYGSEVFSLPFTVDMLTTQTKGELTHFYQGSEKGHEYWLRSYFGIDSANDSVASADFILPAAAASGSKTDDNTFLWDYYYKQSSSLDKNNDQYYQYYESSRTYSNYPLAQAASPYLIGLPGATFYEFDLSGNFVPKNTSGTIGKLDRQVITMVSKQGTDIGVSDDELASGVETVGGYAYRPNYSSSTVPAGSYLLNKNGSRFDVTTKATAPGAFRPYFTVSGSGSHVMPQTRSITFGMPDFEKGSTNDPVQGLKVSVQGKNIVVESGLDHDKDISIVSEAGITVTSFTIAPGSVITTPVNYSGVYMVAGHKVMVY